MQAGGVFRCPSGLSCCTLRFLFFSTEIALLYHSALVILSGYPATTGLNLFTSYDNVPYVWAIIQGVYYSTNQLGYNRASYSEGIPC